MDMVIEQQVALDEAFVPHARRLRIGRSNFRLLSDISSKESTLQLVHDVLRQTPFFKAFLVTLDVPKFCMKEFWATATVHHHSIRFKMENKKHIVNIEYFREMFHICPRLPGQTFDEPPFEEEILAFLRFLGNNGAIRRNSEAYKEYYTFATRVTPPKTKASVRKTKSSSDTTVTPPPTTATGTRLFTFAKGKHPATTSKAKSLTALSEVAMTEAEQLKLATKRSLQQTHISQASGYVADEGTGEDDDDDDDDDEGNDDDDNAQDDDDDQEDANKDDDDQEERDDDDDQEEGNGEENLGLNVGREEGQDEENDADELYRDVNVNLEGRSVQMADVHTT
nr:hypothetical protein [Tanacetum cinerariifolium]